MDEGGGGPDSVSHNGILNNPDLQNQVVKWLGDEGGIVPPSSAPLRLVPSAPTPANDTRVASTLKSNDVTDVVRSISVYGAPATTADGSGNTIRFRSTPMATR